MLLPCLVYLFRWNPSRHTVSHHFVLVISNLVTATPFLYLSIPYLSILLDTLYSITAIRLTRVHSSRYERALKDQPTQKILPEPLDTLVPAVLFLLGQTFVVTSTWALGVTGTFLGDYFGILMDHRVEGFPFNVLRDPMYVGSTMCFAAGALWYEKPAGLLVTVYVYIVYIIALKFEG